MCGGMKGLKQTTKLGDHENKLASCSDDAVNKIGLICGANLVD
jgi:hypothetical protein